MSKEERIEELERMPTMKDVRDLLGVSYGVIYGLIREGRLKAVRVTGGPVSRDAINATVMGLRFRPTDVRQFLLSQTIN